MSINPKMQIESKGYLNEHIHFFYLNDSVNLEVSYHYHDFHKCIIVFEGELDYTVEGREYSLVDGDIILVPKGEVHKLRVKSERYRRLIVYFSEKAIGLLDTNNGNISEIIDSVGKTYGNTSPLSDRQRMKLSHIENELIKKETGFGSESIRLLRFFEWLVIYIGFISHGEKHEVMDKGNQRIEAVLQYIKANITSDLTVESIANEVYTSRYYLMKQFKESVGISIHQYILQERIRCARELMKEDVALTQVAFEVGFKDYSTFLRAFKRQYSYSPREFMKLLPTKP